MKKTIIIALVLTILLLIVLTGCSRSAQTSGVEITNGNSIGNSIIIQDFAFSPETITIKAGDTITWTNKDSAKHTVTSDTGDELASPLIGNGETFTHTFTTKGTYTYKCTPHPGMKGMVVVE